MRARVKRETIAEFRFHPDKSPIISGIQYQKRDPLRASVFLGGEFAFGVQVATIEQFRLRKGDELTASLLEELRAFDAAVSAKRIATKYLNSRRRSRREVETKLLQEGYAQEVIDSTVEALISYGLIDDLAYATAFIHDKLLVKSASKRELELLLKKKGIAKEIIASVVKDTADDGSEEERARTVAEKKWQSIIRRESDSRKQRQKLYSFLASRGFEHSLVKRVVSALSDESTEINDQEEGYETEF